jgi:hypothetical protein
MGFLQCQTRAVPGPLDVAPKAPRGLGLQTGGPSNSAVQRISAGTRVTATTAYLRWETVTAETAYLRWDSPRGISLQPQDLLRSEHLCSWVPGTQCLFDTPLEVGNVLIACSLQPISV